MIKLAEIYAFLKQANQAKQYYLKALAGCEKMHLTHIKASIYSKLAQLMQKENQLLQAMQYLAKSFDYLTTDDKYGMSRYYQSTSEIYLQFNRVDKAIENLKRCLHLWKELPASSQNKELVKLLAELCVQDSRLDEAVKYYSQALELYREDDKFTAQIIESELENLEYT